MLPRNGRIRQCVLVLVWTLLFEMTVSVGTGQEAIKNPIPQSNETSEKIAQWIAQLGDSQYPVREKAQEELRRLGTVAFDDLLAAQDHPDVEIAQRARYLVRSIPIAWTVDSDSAEVKAFLANFGELARNERKTRAQHLATLDNGAGIEPLCRIVRFESDRVLSKQAALLVLSRAGVEDPGKRRQNAEIIRKNVASSKRPAIEWLLTFARELEKPDSTLTDWDRITRAELATLSRSPQQSDRTVARDLLRWQTRLLLNRNRTQEAMANFRRTYDLIDDETAEIYEVIDWSIENKLYSAPDEIANRFSARIRIEPRLLYRLAEAQLKRGDPERAEKTAAEARGWNPTKTEDHLAAAELLYRRGLVEWSANEYRSVIAELKVESEEGIDARDRFSKMLVDSEREMEAADVIQPLIDFADTAPKQFDNLQLVNSYFRGYMHFWRGIHFGKIGNREKQIEHLKKAIEASPTNIDILIAMFRLSNPDDQWKKDVQQRIDAHLGKCRTLIDKSEELIKRQPNFEAAASEQLATAYNELAWLISNTTGDFQEALRASKRSLELSPNNEAYLDTLGRCFYAAGDLENAVSSQRKAVAAAPFMQVMQRQLKMFEQALAEQKAKAKSQSAKSTEPAKT